MIKNILTIIFMLLGITYTFGNVVRANRGLAISDGQVWLMGIGIVGTIACLFMTW